MISGYQQSWHRFLEDSGQSYNHRFLNEKIPFEKATCSGLTGF